MKTDTMVKDTTNVYTIICIVIKTAIQLKYSINYSPVNQYISQISKCTDLTSLIHFFQVTKFVIVNNSVRHLWEHWCDYKC